MSTLSHKLASAVITGLLLLPAFSHAGPTFNLMTADMHPVINQNNLKAPDWVNNPAIEDHLAVLSAVPAQEIGGLQAQYLAAMEDAQQQLTAKFKAFQKDLQFIQRNNNSADARAYTDNAIKDLVFNKAIVKDEWTDPQSGKLFIWMVLPTSNQFSAQHYPE